MYINHCLVGQDSSDHIFFTILFCNTPREVSMYPCSHAWSLVCLILSILVWYSTSMQLIKHLYRCGKWEAGIIKLMDDKAGVMLSYFKYFYIQRWDACIIMSSHRWQESVLIYSSPALCACCISSDCDTIQRGCNPQVPMVTLNPYPYLALASSCCSYTFHCCENVTFRKPGFWYITSYPLGCVVDLHVTYKTFRTIQPAHP